MQFTAKAAKNSSVLIIRLKEIFSSELQLHNQIECHYVGISSFGENQAKFDSRKAVFQKIMKENLSARAIKKNRDFRLLSSSFRIVIIERICNETTAAGLNRHLSYLFVKKCKRFSQMN